MKAEERILRGRVRAGEIRRWICLMSLCKVDFGRLCRSQTKRVWIYKANARGPPTQGWRRFQRAGGFRDVERLEGSWRGLSERGVRGRHG